MKNTEKYLYLKNKKAIKIKEAKTFFQKAIGLMFSSKKNFNFALVFYLSKGRIKNSLHMLFVFYHILVVFLDENKIVVDKNILYPFQLKYIPKKECNYVIELPVSFDNKIKLGDKINWK